MHAFDYCADLPRTANRSSLHCSRLGVTTLSLPSHSASLLRPTSKPTTCSRFCMSSHLAHRYTTNRRSADLEMTVNTLIQIDKLVQLLESPVFTCTCQNYCRRNGPANARQISASSSSSRRSTLTCTSACTGSSCFFRNRLRLQR